MTISLKNWKDALKGGFAYLGNSAAEVRDFVDRLYQHTILLDVPTDADGDFTDPSDSVWYAEEAGQVLSAYFLTAGTITAHGTNYTTLALNKRDGAGGAATVMASRATDTVTTDDVAAFVPWALTLSGTVANTQFASGNVLSVSGTKASAGVTVPTGVVVVVYKER